MRMSSFLMFILECLIFVAEGVMNDTKCPNVKTELSFLRRRRHVAFPDGSNVVLTASLVKAFMTHAPSGWNIALELDVLFPLPDSKFTLAQHRRKLHHRQKRELWDRLKAALDLQSFNGHSCILRSICDAQMHLLPPGTSLIHDILRAIFSAPRHEDKFLKEMKTGYNELFKQDFCHEAHDCPISLLNLITELNLDDDF